jgi:hypothetical protein
VYGVATLELIVRRVRVIKEKERVLMENSGPSQSLKHPIRRGRLGLWPNHRRNPDFRKSRRPSGSCP